MTAEPLGASPAKAPAWIPSDDSFAARLALVRWRMGWNVKEAALACGVPAATWRLWEMDGALPRRLVQTCRVIADRTGCDYGWLLDGRRPFGAQTTGPKVTPTEKATLCRPNVQPKVRARPKVSQPVSAPKRPIRLNDPTVRSELVTAA